MSLALPVDVRRLFLQENKISHFVLINSSQKNIEFVYKNTTNDSWENTSIKWSSDGKYHKDENTFFVLIRLNVCILSMLYVLILIMDKYLVEDMIYYLRINVTNIHQIMAKSIHLYQCFIFYQCSKYTKRQTMQTMHHEMPICLRTKQNP